MTKSVESVEMVPTWKAAAQIYVMAIQHGTREGKRAGIEGVMEMADKLDALRANQMAKRETGE